MKRKQKAETLTETLLLGGWYRSVSLLRVTEEGVKSGDMLFYIVCLGAAKQKAAIEVCEVAFIFSVTNIFQSEY